MDRVPQPLFAPVSQSAQNDDFDLNEIFAEYFVNEFDDPLNAYTGGMANYGGGVASMALTQEQNNTSKSTTLPTGGIRTAFHTGVAPAPAPKKVKTDNMMEQQQQQQIPSISIAPTPLAVLMNQQQQEQQLLMQQHAQVLSLNGQQQQQQQQQQIQGNQQVSLPVGVGIKLGGVGGVAPSTAQTGATVPQTTGVPGTQYSHNIMWAPNNMVQNQNGAVTEKAVEERRQRNREHAKRSRVRKKFMLESLQEQVQKLQRDNTHLRMLVQEHIPDHAMQIIAECCTSNHLFDDNAAGQNNNNTGTGMPGAAGNNNLVRSDFSLMRALTSGQKCFVLSDPKLPDNPIIFATPDFYKLTGYTSKEVLGRNCRFLQGPGTDKRAIEVLRKAISSGSDATVCLLNYKADGTPFWNQFFIAALRDSDNNIVNFVGVQTEVEPEAAGSSYLEDKVNAVLPLSKDEKDKEDEKNSP